MFTQQILFREVGMRGASVHILDQLLEMSVTGDTTKYLVLDSGEVVQFHQRT